MFDLVFYVVFWSVANWASRLSGSSAAVKTARWSPRQVTRILASFDPCRMGLDAATSYDRLSQFVTGSTGAAALASSGVVYAMLEEHCHCEFSPSRMNAAARAISQLYIASGSPVVCQWEAA